MKTIDVKKVLGETPTNAFEAIDLMNKAQQQVFDAINIMQSALEYPDETEFHNKKMSEYVKRFEVS